MVATPGGAQSLNMEVEAMAVGVPFTKEIIRMKSWLQIAGIFGRRCRRTMHTSRQRGRRCAPQAFLAAAAQAALDVAVAQAATRWQQPIISWRIGNRQGTRKSN